VVLGRRLAGVEASRPTGAVGGGDFVEAELLHITLSKEIDDQLAKIKSEVASKS